MNTKSIGRFLAFVNDLQLFSDVLLPFLKKQKKIFFTYKEKKRVCAHGGACARA